MGYQIQILFNKGLTESEQQLCYDYWQCNPNKLRDFYYPIRDLSEKYHLSQGGISNFVKQHCQLILSDFHCVSCGTVASLSLRGQMASLRLENWTCEPCFQAHIKAVHEQFQADKRAKALAYQAAKQQSSLTKDSDNIDKGVYLRPPTNNLTVYQESAMVTLLDTLLLYTFVQTMMNLHNGVSYRLSDIAEGTLSPTHRLDEWVIRHLERQGLLEGIDAQSNVTEMDYSDLQFRSTLSNHELRAFVFTLNDPKTQQAIVNDANYGYWYEQLQIAECERYFALLQHQTQTIDEVVFSNYLENVVTDWVRQFSIAQITYLIWTAIKDTNKDKSSTKPYPDRLVQRLVELSDSFNNRSPYNTFNRHRQLPASSLATMVVDNIFGHHDVIFHYALKNLLLVPNNPPKISQ